MAREWRADERRECASGVGVWPAWSPEEGRRTRHVQVARERVRRQRGGVGFRGCHGNLARNMAAPLRTHVAAWPVARCRGTERRRVESERQSCVRAWLRESLGAAIAGSESLRLR